jgi:glutamine amidotransferase
VRVAIIDYRAGNLASVVKALRAVDAEPVVASSRDDLVRARAIVVPGVGHFQATQALEAIRVDLDACIAAGVPTLGICLGMQWLFDGSEEAAGASGLGWFAGRCSRLDGPVKVPHVGWNLVTRTSRPSRLLADVPPETYAYFAHTFAAPEHADSVAVTTHGRRFPAVIERGTLFGTQFHPEKSGRAGLHMLANFLRIAREAGTSC